VTDIARRAIADFRDDLARARDDLEAIADIIDADFDADDLLVKESSGVATRVNKEALIGLLDRLSDAPEAMTTAFEEFDWQTRKALQTLQQALTRKTVEGA
jgi:hypothetical protein